MSSDGEPFEFRATLADLDRGLDTIHESIEHLRAAARREEGDKPLMLFETALAEIGNNALTHGRIGSNRPVDYVLRYAGGNAIASFVDGGPPVNGGWARTMPPATSEAGRGLALARSLLDELSYARRGGLNGWRLVKRL